MTAVIAEQSVSLDGFSAGANQSPANPMGDGGQRLHEWSFDQASSQDAEVLHTYRSRVGAVILGRRMYDQGLAFWDGSNPWGVPAFVLTHENMDASSGNGDIPFTFVADGIESALHQAGASCGDKDVAIAGGATTIRQYIAAGYLDELHLRLVPIILGSGIRLLDGVGNVAMVAEPLGASFSPGVTHLRYRLVR